MVAATVPPVAFQEQEELTRRNAFRKKSIIGIGALTRLQGLRRMSFQRSLSTPMHSVSFKQLDKNI